MSATNIAMAFLGVKAKLFNFKGIKDLPSFGEDGSPGEIGIFSSVGEPKLFIVLYQD